MRLSSGLSFGLSSGLSSGLSFCLPSGLSSYRPTGLLNSASLLFYLVVYLAYLVILVYLV